MQSLLPSRTLLASLSLLACSVPVSAHLSYTGRNLGTFSGLALQSNTITGQTIPNSWAWADGTDEDFVHSHDIRFFRFTLESTASVTLSVTSLDPGATLPGFSIYSGLAHASPADYETDLTLQYLATLPGPTKEGAMNSLGTWKMGNDASLTYDDFSTFTYIGHAADGTSANYGSADGVNGDGTADGFVSGTFLLPAGDYTVAIGGANYNAQGGVATPVGMAVGVTVVPEPTTGILAVSGLLYLGAMRRSRGNCRVETQQAS